jgi:hypothetical protein
MEFPPRRCRIDNSGSLKLVCETQPHMDTPARECLTNKELKSQGFVSNLDSHVKILRGDPLPQDNLDPIEIEELTNLAPTNFNPPLCEHLISSPLHT